MKYKLVVLFDIDPEEEPKEVVEIRKLLKKHGFVEKLNYFVDEYFDKDILSWFIMEYDTDDYEEAERRFAWIYANVINESEEFKTVLVDQIRIESGDKTILEDYHMTDEILAKYNFDRK